MTKRPNIMAFRLFIEKSPAPRKAPAAEHMLIGEANRSFFTAARTSASALCESLILNTELRPDIGRMQIIRVFIVFLILF